MENAIDIKQLTKVYKNLGSKEEKIAVQALSLKIRRASIFGLLGPNGAGKSTVINIVAGLTNKTSGNVVIWGFDQDKNPMKSRECIGVVPQELNFDPFLTPREALEIQAGLFGVAKRNRRTSEILSALGLTDVSDSYSRSLSGGMKRRLLMAKALVHSPPILILDEPTAGVDIDLREMIWNYIEELNNLGTTIVLTTHYLEEAEKMCDEIAILNDGVIEKCGETKELLAELDNKVLIIHPNEKIKSIPALPKSVLPSIRSDGALVLSFDRSEISVQQLIDMCRRSGLSIRDIATAEPDLKDIFRLVTKQKPKPSEKTQF